VLLSLCIALYSLVHAQAYNNEWIDYSKTYYKFKIGPFGFDGQGWPVKKGIVRIPRATLAAAGLGAVPAGQLQLWRDGQEIPVYVSCGAGVPGPNDFIEFWGEIEDGTADNALYTNPASQASDYWSLETDSSTYFITVNSRGNNKRLTFAANETAPAGMQPQANFMYTTGRYYRSQINGGLGAKYGQDIMYSASYEAGEGFTSPAVNPLTPLYWAQGGLFADVTGAPATVSFCLAGNAFASRTASVFFNNQLLGQYPANYFNIVNRSTGNINPSLLASDSLLVTFTDASQTNDDNFVVASAQLTYARKFNFGGKPSFEFTLDSSASGRYIKISNFSAGSGLPVLYDLTNNFAYQARLQAGYLYFFLPPSVSPYQLALARGDGSTATIVNSLQQKQFVDFTQSNQQGNYIIISNPLIYGVPGSTDYVNQYCQYRRSAQGGGYNAVIVDINQLIDQFAFGIAHHPLAIKNFLRFARNRFLPAQSFVFIIGKGLTYASYRNNPGPIAESTDLVPTFGDPGSDNLLSSNDFTPLPATPIGRLSAVKPQEVGAYLDKVKEYEIAQQSGNNGTGNTAWMKNVLQLSGEDDPSLSAPVDQMLNAYQRIISDTLFGANVTTYSKSARPLAFPQMISNFANVFNQGSSIVNYLGHASSTNLDFGLDNPVNYNNKGKYPLFIVNGCHAGNIFDYDANRFNNVATVSEKFTLASSTGAIGFLAPSSYAMLNYIGGYTTKLFELLTNTGYGKSTGEIVSNAIAAAYNSFGPTDFLGRIHGEQLTLQGDPALKINSFNNPDYVVNDASITINPAYVSIADDSFSVKVVVSNRGRATNNPVHFSLLRKLRNGQTSTVFTKVFATLKTTDSVIITLPIIANRDNGTQQVIASINDDGAVAEISTANNTVSKTFTISAQEVKPVYPYNNAMVTAGSVTLAASTANPLDSARRYVMQLDTTALFNSPAKITETVTTTGGLVEYKNINLPFNNTVYYWRVAVDSAAPHWNMFSFMHNSNNGMGQFHFYQYAQSNLNHLQADTISHSLKFTEALSNLFVKQAIYPYSGAQDADFSVGVNGTQLTQSACLGHSIIFNVLNPVTLNMYQNTTNPFGAAAPCAVTRANNFEYPTNSPAGRDSAAMFMKYFVHDGDYVVARSIDTGNLANVWAADSAYFGSSNTLYTLLKKQGIAIDKYDHASCYIFVFKKNDSTHFTPVSVFSTGLYDAISLSQNIRVADTAGYVNSPVFGPAKKWQNVEWNGTNQNSNNTTYLNVIGLDTTNTPVILFTIDRQQKQLDISSVDAKKYPRIMLQMHTKDSITAQPFKLANWQVHYDMVAEYAIAPNFGANIPTTVKFTHATAAKGDTLTGYTIFKNVSTQNIDSLKIAVTLYDVNGNTYNFPATPIKPLAAGDTVKAGFAVDVSALQQGSYNMHLSLVSSNNAAEQYLFNDGLFNNITLSREATLPKQIINFTGQPGVNGIMLTWQVANQQDIRLYNVEYSTDGLSFTQIASVDAAGTTGTNTLSYQYLHTHPVAGKNYYRLKMVNKDGTYTYSTVVEKNYGEALISAYPNPFFERLNITMPAGSSQQVVRIFDAASRLVLQQKLQPGLNTLDVSKFTAGSYFVQAGDGANMQLFKMQKQ